MRYLKIFEELDRDNIRNLTKMEEEDRNKYWDEYLKDLNAEINKPKDNHDDYYKLIDNSDWDKYEDELSKLFKINLDFTEDEISAIKKMVPKIYDCNILPLLSKKKKCIELIRTKKGGCVVRIWKLNDEWFLTSLGSINRKPGLDERGTIYFKCDQFDGLQYFLNRTLIK